MKSIALALSLLIAPAAYADTCFGPGGCVCPEGQVWDNCQHTSVGPGPCIPGCIAAPTPVVPTGPAQLCIAGVCAPVVYGWKGDIATAESTAPSGYQVIGWAGPCGYSDRSQCPDIFNQAFADLRLNALKAHRAQRF
jgi:hypothetical protein